MANTDAEIRAKITAHRDALESLADSDLPANWVAQALLEAAEEVDE